VAVIVHTDSETVSLQLVDLLVDPPESIFYEVIARHDDHGADVHATGRIELVRDGDYPAGLAIRMTYETHVLPSSRFAGTTFEPAHHRWVYAEGKYWQEDD
jgi:hypothetical protein